LLLLVTKQMRETVKNLFSLVVVVFSLSSNVYADQFLGILNGNPYDPKSITNPYGAGSPYKPNSINNPYGTYGSPYSDRSATNPYTTNAPKIYDKQGNYRGRLSKNPYDPESVSNPYGRYGSPYSPDSINNPYGAGNPYNGNEFYLFGED
jgi:hypothetical protein